VDGPLTASVCQSWVVNNQRTGAIHDRSYNDRAGSGQISVSARFLRQRPTPPPRHPGDHLDAPKRIDLNCTITVQTSHWAPLQEGPNHQTPAIARKVGSPRRLQMLTVVYTEPDERIQCLGFEDIRLFEWQDDLWCTATTRQFNPEAQSFASRQNRAPDCARSQSQQIGALSIHPSINTAIRKEPTDYPYGIVGRSSIEYAVSIDMRCHGAQAGFDPRRFIPNDHIQA
jgi:hypothetical protein